MGVAKLTAGDGYTYLTRQVAAHDSTEKGRASLEDYYSERGESPGRWCGAGLAALEISAGSMVTEAQMKSLFGLGRHPDADALEAARAAAGGTPDQVAAAGALGRPFNVYAAASDFNVAVAKAFTAFNLERGERWNASIPVDERARIRTEIGREMFTERHSRAPVNDRELDGFVKTASRKATSAVAGYDLTFSPVKSVSTLWALAPMEVAEQIRDAHDAAVADAVAWIESEVAFTREGRGGARQVRVRGLVATAFTHRDTRAGDPSLHTHLAVSNKVQTLDGRWLALDGRVLYQAITAASERYNTRLEAELGARLGVAFGSVDRNGKRPVRELVGVSPGLIRWWSTRRRMIASRQEELAVHFQANHGRPPTPVESYGLGRQAWRETRAAKHAPTSEAEQRTAWREDAIAILGDAASVDQMINDAIQGGAPTITPDTRWYADTAAAVIDAVSKDRATWKVWHLRAEAERQTRTAGIPLVDLDHAVDRLVTDALALSIRLGSPDPVTEPRALRRHGESVYEVHGATTYTSAAVLDAEQRLLATARTGGGARISQVRVDIALAQPAAAGIELNDAQAAMVRELATSGARLQLALAPAGTGKTTAMGVLTRAWLDTGGHVVGLAPSAQAAHELRASVHCTTDTLAKLAWEITHHDQSTWPEWINQIDATTLVIIDEAGQASTTELAAVVDFITSRGGVVRLIGDNQQLAAVGAGGILRDIEETVGAVTLSQVRRFTDPAEAAVTLAVRAGDHCSLGFYADNDRVHVGDLGAVTNQAYEAWKTDRAAGLDSVLLAPTRDLVSRLNSRARTERIADHPTGPDVVLVDGNHASVGDVIITRRNQRTLALSPTDWVKNGDRWTITAVDPDGTLRARHNASTAAVTLPATYVAEHVQLGYASTVHGAQGMTTDTSHTVVIGDESRELLYVAVSRGRAGNHVYVANGYDGDPHTLIHPEALHPHTALDVLATILDRDGTQTSATTAQREADAPETLLHAAALRYHDALGYAAEQHLDEKLTTLDTDLEVLYPGLTHEDAYPTLRAHLALVALNGTDPVAAVLDAAAVGELDSSEDRAAVLDWRLPSTGAGPLPWLDQIPSLLAADDIWGPYLTARSAQVTRLAADVREAAADLPEAAAPAWAHGLPRDLRSDVAVWRAAYGINDKDLRPNGTRQPGSGAGRLRQDLDNRIRAAVGHPASQAHYDLPEEVLADRNCAALTHHLAALDQAGIPIGPLLSQALTHTAPLPDVHTADALWWRIVRHLGPAALQATGRDVDHLRPAWSPDLAELLGAELAARVQADASWPALVAAIHARPPEWTPRQLLSAVIDTRTRELPAADVCTALVWRVATMTDIPEDQPDEPDHYPPRSDHVAEVSAGARILDLNAQALAYYEHRYDHSWAPRYIDDRLHSNPRDQGHRLGYAPPGPNSLVRHLVDHGATIDELLQAGLARATDRGTVVDVFRDRLMFPIRDDQGVVGFIGRRNPTKTDSDPVGPKYLNTRATAVFTKGTCLYGLQEHRRELDAGATPVLVEGPMDALAVSSTRGGYVGIAPLGTAFTTEQAHQIAPYAGPHHDQIILATDPDAAGRTAATKALWRLAALRIEPRYLTLPEAVDPADRLRAGGPRQLLADLNQANPMVDHLIDVAIQQGRHEDAFRRVDIAREVVPAIAATSPNRWLALTERLCAGLDLTPASMHLEVFEEGQSWTNDPGLAAERALTKNSHATMAPVTAVPAGLLRPALPTPPPADHVAPAMARAINRRW
ncbi:MAG: MobF family relaxase [Nocardioides sp.]